MSQAPFSPPAVLAADFDLAGRTALVTGASSGLGRRMAHCLLRKGVRVIAVGRRGDRLASLVGSYGADQVMAAEVDVRDAVGVEQLLARAADWAPTIEFLVNAAGVVNISPAEDETPEAFQSVIDTNLNGTYNLCHHVGRLMLGAGRGSIVNIVSVNGLIASGTLPEASYCASKGAVISLTRELAAQWARRGVRVNAIAPGYFHSEMSSAMLERPAGRRRLLRVPMGRAGAEHELDGPLTFLLSDASSYMTGQTIVVDGGWSIV